MTDTKNNNRLLSLDTLRGFDMFWIIGGDLLFRSLGKVSGWQWAGWWGEQLNHVKWDGFHAYDLVFPLFMFMSGVAIPYAILGKLDRGVSKSVLYKKVITRAVVLVILGFVYNGILELNFEKFRFASVLGQIGLAYLIAAFVAINTRSFKVRAIWTVGIMLSYALIQLVVPVPHFGAGVLSPEGSINGFIDQLFLPGRLYGGTFDPEGILCILSASAITLMGALAGEIIRSKVFTPLKTALVLGMSAIGLIILALLISPYYPFIKSIWTTSFNLLAGGLSLLLLSIFYLLIDVWGFKRWTFFFRVIGMNSITIYMAIRLLNFHYTADFLFGGLSYLFGTFEPVIGYSALLLLEWLFLYFLYKKSIFLKV